MSSSRVVMSFRRVELNVFSSSQVEFLPSQMSFRQVKCLFVELNVFSSSLQPLFVESQCLLVELQ